ncbi:MAG: hypothetical protein D6691_00880 [Candidatus Hydrogenedentota bacterium]|uniref:Lipoprotein n=1 Tax=Sumerlaea chitinivorans TaxID=2250252 RepID=A0A2Z4Y6P0_SUMC1|nr:hypothetical protein BRCON_1822 [Candidatus Sumerlaea chitinivorans]RMH30714.1 MAG: hypothetical protein D6691_00880 [Candidatus Hydrogenedentota bacterium]GIX45488.1 MAG: hypothetical protein KatS3mg130_1896 [Candidatus Sumerlaea sp.]
MPENDRVKRSRVSCVALLVTVALAMIGCATMTPSHKVEPDWCLVTASAPYRPVEKPGMQRREAQNDAEQLARRELLNRVGALRLPSGQTVNDVIARDTRLRAEVLQLVRTAEVYDWRVNPQHECVQVWVRLDLNRVRALFQPTEQPPSR